MQAPGVVKGVLTAEDAALAVEHGAAASSSPTTAAASSTACWRAPRRLREVVDAVEGRAPGAVDGGVRRGTDVAAALAAGGRCLSVAPPFGVWPWTGRRASGGCWSCWLSWS